MATISRAVFAKAAGLSAALADRWYAPVSGTLVEFSINTPARQAMFLAQISHESAGFTQLVESFNYAPAALSIFSRIPATMRGQLGRQSGERAVPLDRQQQIANLAYASRYGNGEAASGDGWRYRGRGLKQITFRDNYRDCGRALGTDLAAQPDLLAASDALAARSAGWYWQSTGCNSHADRGDFAATTRAINGPAMTGHDRRSALYAAAKTALTLLA